jgi:geranylgeranyl reductase family protein
MGTGADRTDDLDLLVVGAGPSGAAAATVAARHGHRVTVVDRARFPRDKTCGDGLTTRALHLLEGLGVTLDTLASVRPVHETVIVGPDGARVRLPHPTHGLHAAVVPRRELDARLVDLARDAGATVREGWELDELSLGTTAATARSASGEVLRARWVIGADGHWSKVRAAAGFTPAPRHAEWGAFRQYVSGTDVDALWVLFERDLLPGYAWIFPLPDGRANLGFGMLRSDAVKGRALARTWRDLLDRPSIRDVLGPHARLEGPARAWPIPVHYSPLRLAARGALLVGDAASVDDPMTGEGIAQSIETGMLAAESIIGGGTRERVEARYRERVERALGRDLRFAERLQRILRTERGTRWSIAAAGLTPWTRRNFARWMWEDYPRATVLTPDRWRRGVFTGPGAYLDR